MALSHKANITAAALVTALQQAAARYAADSTSVPQSLTDSIISLQADLGKVAADSLTAKTVWLSISIAAVAILAIGSAASLLFCQDATTACVAYRATTKSPLTIVMTHLQKHAGTSINQSLSPYRSPFNIKQL